MKQKLSESIQIPEGVSCELKGLDLVCKKGSTELVLDVNIPGISTKVKDGSIFFECVQGNKNEYKIIKSLLAHAKNQFTGLEGKYIYKLEAANVHFPMTFKVDGNKFIINNFLGEKKSRFADIVKGSTVEVKGQKITVTSNSKTSAGQTSANLEKATRVRNRDRRIFQDGIFIIEKAGVQ